MNIDNVPIVITVCCILHMCEIHGDTFNELRMEDIGNLQQPVSAGMLTSAIITDREKTIWHAIVMYCSN